MRQLVTLAVGIGPGVHESDHALHAVGTGPDQQQEADHQHHDQPCKQPPVHAAEEEDAHRDHRDDRKGAEIGLHQQQAAGQHHHREHRQKALAQAVHEGGLAYGVVGGIEHHCHLHQLRGLEVDHIQRQPAPAAVDLATNARNQHQREQAQPAEEKEGGELLPHSQRHLEHHCRGDQADQHKHRVAGQVIGRVVAGHAAAFSDRNRRRIHHHQSDRKQQGCHPEQAMIVFRWGRARAGAHGVGAHARLRCSAATAAANTSARCT